MVLFICGEDGLPPRSHKPSVLLVQFQTPHPIDVSSRVGDDPLCACGELEYEPRLCITRRQPFRVRRTHGSKPESSITAMPQRTSSDFSGGRETGTNSGGSLFASTEAMIFTT